MKRALLILVILLMTTALVFAAGGSQQPTSSGGTGPITVEVFDRGTDGGRTLAANNNYTKWIQEKVKKDLNIDVTFQPVGRWSETTDLTNMLWWVQGTILHYRPAGK